MSIKSFFNDAVSVIAYGDTKKNLNEEYQRELAESKASHEFWTKASYGLGLAGVSVVLVIILIKFKS